MPSSKHDTDAAGVGRPLPPMVRRQSLIAAMRDAGSVTVGSLARQLQVSAVTIYRDLALLEGEGVIVRVQGGATLVEGDATRFTSIWQQRLRQRPQAKMAMAVEARELLAPHSTIFLDGSTSSLALAAVIEAEPLPITIVTVSPVIAFALQARGVHIVIVPGSVEPDLRSIGGVWATEFLAELHLSASFVSGAGFTLQQGLTTTRREIAMLTQCAMAQAESNICLVDSSKFRKTAMLTIAPASGFEAIVTDADIDRGIRKEFESAGVRLVQASPTSYSRAARILSSSGIWALALSDNSRGWPSARGNDHDVSDALAGQQPPLLAVRMPTTPHDASSARHRTATLAAHHTQPRSAGRS